MNVDIRLAVGFWQHPKVYRLEKAIGLKGIRSLQILWCWCAQNRPDGSLQDLSADEIEFVADWRGKRGAFITACLGNWLDQDEAGYRLHEWVEHNPWQAQAQERSEARRAAARKAANARWAARHDTPDTEEDGCGCNANAYANAYAAGCDGNADAYADAMPPIPIPDPIPDKSMNGDREGDTATPVSSPASQPLSNHTPPAGQGGAETEGLPPKPPLPDISPQAGLSDGEGSLEFLQLREWWDDHMRSEGPRAGWQEYLAVKKIRDGTGRSIWPGFIYICDDADKRKEAGVWSQGYEPGLARYLKDRTWLAAVKPRAQPKPRATSLKDQRSLEREQMAQALLDYEAENGSIL